MFSGHLRCVFDFGFERQEIIFPKKLFSLGQYHDMRFSRKHNGATVVLQVDNNEPVEFTFDIKASADAQFNNIQYMYIGKNLSMTDGFVGCVSRVQFDDIYPLKLLFQQNSPPNVKSLGAGKLFNYIDKTNKYLNFYFSPIKRRFLWSRTSYPSANRNRNKAASNYR